MEAGLREVCRSVRIGKILIQRVYGNPSVPYEEELNRCLGRRDGSPQALLLQGRFVMAIATRDPDPTSVIVPSGHRQSLCAFT
jgi:hypothetical protein